MGFDCLDNHDYSLFTKQKRSGGFVMLSQMLSGGFDPNEFTVCSVLNTCGEEKELRFGKQLHFIVAKKAYDLDVYVETSLEDMYVKLWQIEATRTLFDRMKRRNTITWNTILEGYARNGLGEEAIRLFRMMKRVKVTVNNLTMVSFLRACGLLKALSTESADKAVVSWTTSISGYACLGHEYEALEYLKEMLGEACSKNGYCSEALKVMYRIQAEGIEVDDYIFPTVSLLPMKIFSRRRSRHQSIVCILNGTYLEGNLHS
ncbi:UNVERIFIED_CONTAM: Pentatricopeptide repeat-containing protein, chloroplastic [Sesamum radiatum]|uniref:Pentatricopeptide repeat-containing protein, chloroplastic n=1 Tax=Sesamum radiatum TaxID=300843 RepID=A0AAW2QH63_SESRA